MEKRKIDYITNLLQYTLSFDRSYREYFENLAEKIRSGKQLNLMKWELDNPFLTSEDIKKLIESNDEDICKYFALAMEKVIDLNLELIKKEKEEEQKKKDSLVPVSPNQSLVPVPERKLPAIKEEPLTRKDMEEVIDEKLPKDESLSRSDLEEVIDEKMPKDESLSRQDIEDVVEDKINKMSPLKVMITNISRKITDLLNGFAVVRESKTGRTHLYYHDAKSDSLKGKTTFYNNQLNIESGYYINFDEYISKMMGQIVDQFPEVTKLTFIRNDGLERTPMEVSEEAFAIARKEGAIRFGKALQKANIESYNQLLNAKLDSMEEYQGEQLKSGFYVRRDVLARIFNCYKVRVTLPKKEENVEKGIQK